MSTPLLQVENLSVGFGPAGSIPILTDVSFELAAGETLALVGESGSGKSMTAMSLVKLLPKGARLSADRIELAGSDLLRASERQLNEIRGKRIGALFQQPKRMLDPTSTVATQLSEPLRHALGMSRRDAYAAAVDLLRDVGIPEPARRAKSYAHQLSGGMAQRVMIAMALAGQPSLLIADEPTAALDVTVEAQILELIAEKKRELNMSMLFISHDLRVVAEVADRIAVMYAGRIVEEGPAAELIGEPRHPYTRALIECSMLNKTPDGQLYAIPGSALSARRAVRGCRFHARCTVAHELHLDHQCTSEEPALLSIGMGPGAQNGAGQSMHRSRCWMADHAHGSAQQGTA